MAKIQLEKPDWLLGDETHIERKRFHDREIDVFVGDVALDSIQGWIGIPERNSRRASSKRRTEGSLATMRCMYWCLAIVTARMG